MTDKIEDKLKTEEERAKEFVVAYEELCKKHGFNIVVVPAFKAMADTGTFAVVLQTQVGRLKEVKS